jgi:hypothetical protein
MDDIVDDIMNVCITRLKKDEYKSMDPLIEYIGKRVWPYIVFAGAMFTLLLVILLVLLVTILHHHKLTKPFLCNRSL